MYSVQVREPLKKTDIGIGSIVTPFQNDRAWKNLSANYDELHLAENKGKQLISEERYKAEDVRIVSVVATFHSTIQVEMKLAMGIFDDDDEEEPEEGDVAEE